MGRTHLSHHSAALAITLALAATLAFAPAVSAEQPSAPPRFDYEAMEKRAETYFAAYQKLDIKAMAESYHTNVEFLDETAEAIGPAYRMSGKEAIRTAFESFLPSLLRLRIEFSEKYFAGKIGVFRGSYHARVKGGAIGRSQDQHFDIEYPFITVLEFTDGLVSKHIDYIDYQKMAQLISTLEPVASGP